MHCWQDSVDLDWSAEVEDPSRVDRKDQGNGAKALAARIEIDRGPVKILSLKRSISQLIQSPGQISDPDHADPPELAEDLTV